MPQRFCHVCKKYMEKLDLHKQAVDICHSCNGIFFDKGELESVIRLVKLFRNAELEEEDIDSVPEHEHKRIVFCPEDGSEMIPQDLAGLTIDICQKCGGIWLDRGEIASLKLAENHIRQNLSLYIRLGE
jgi:Zn-finger nucleic acid-binding protein